ncbi:MAG: L,D-transpeptidase family protein [Bacteroidota bacterium]|nr:L,D-transpeptidase family protein [Bacteroidota bacterium]
MKFNQKLSIVLILSLLFALNACKRKTKLDNVVEDFDFDKLTTEIHSEIDSLKKDHTYKHYFDTLYNVYKQQAFKPIWLEKINDSLFVDSIRQISDSLIYDGFIQSHYGFSKLLSLIDSIKISKNQYNHLAKIELLLSNSLLTLWHDKVLGRTNPIQLFGNKYSFPYPNHPDFELLQVLDTNFGIKKIIEYKPYHPYYPILKQELKQRFGISVGSETIIDTTGIRKISPDNEHISIPSISKRLLELGLIHDSVYLKLKDTVYFIPELVKAITKFQKMFNLTDDGIIGVTTLKALNYTRNNQMDAIRANLERLRWIGQEPEKPYIEVNLPEFMLYMHYPDSTKAMKVCIGKGKERLYDKKTVLYQKTGRYFDKPLNHETPQIYAYVEYVILNPTWTVPSSIVGREMFSKIVKDPGYLIRNNYEVLKGNQVINPYTINWKNYTAGKVPFKFRQSAGDDNALGKIKFTFKNDFSIYMHDTPLKSKFNDNNRAVSHGCVRVENPSLLSEFLLQNNEKIKIDDVRIMMGLPPYDEDRLLEWENDTSKKQKIIKTTYPIRIEKRPIVMFNYITTVFDENNRMRLLFDLYDKNNLIIEKCNLP